MNNTYIFSKNQLISLVLLLLAGFPLYGMKAAAKPAVVAQAPAQQVDSFIADIRTGSKEKVVAFLQVFPDYVNFESEKYERPLVQAIYGAFRGGKPVECYAVFDALLKLGANASFTIKDTTTGEEIDIIDMIIGGSDSRGQEQKWVDEASKWIARLRDSLPQAKMAQFNTLLEMKMLERAKKKEFLAKYRMHQNITILWSERQAEIREKMKAEVTSQDRLAALKRIHQEVDDEIAANFVYQEKWPGAQSLLLVKMLRRSIKEDLIHYKQKSGWTDEQCLKLHKIQSRRVMKLWRAKNVFAAQEAFDMYRQVTEQVVREFEAKGEAMIKGIEITPADFKEMENILFSDQIEELEEPITKLELSAEELEKRITNLELAALKKLEKQAQEAELKAETAEKEAQEARKVLEELKAALAQLDN